MSGKILFVIISGSGDEVKALWGMRMALNSYIHPYGERMLDDVRVLLFADGVGVVNSELPGHERFVERLNHLEQVGVEVVACVSIASELGLVDEYRRLGIPLVHASAYVAERVSEGFTVLTF